MPSSELVNGSKKFSSLGHIIFWYVVTMICDHIICGSQRSVLAWVLSQSRARKVDLLKVTVCIAVQKYLTYSSRYFSLC
jgi:hypothetical protein